MLKSLPAHSAFEYQIDQGSGDPGEGRVNAEAGER